MHLNPNSPLNEWNFSDAEMLLIEEQLEHPLLAAYLNTQLALMFYNMSEIPSCAHPSNGNDKDTQERVDKAMLQGARMYHASLYSTITTSTDEV